MTSTDLVVRQHRPLGSRCVDGRGPDQTGQNLPVDDGLVEQRAEVRDVRLARNLKRNGMSQQKTVTAVDLAEDELIRAALSNNTRQCLFDQISSAEQVKAAILFKADVTHNRELLGEESCISENW